MTVQPPGPNKPPHKKRKRRKMILLAVSVLLLVMVAGIPALQLLIYGLSSRTLPAHSKQTAVVSHRGGAVYAPENTLAAIDSGLFYQANFIEIDIRQTKDSQLVVIHDRSVDRTTNGRGPVHTLTWTMIRALNASEGMPGYASATHIPLLQEVLERMQESKARLIIEIKNPSLYPGIAERLAALLTSMHMGNRVVIFSFDTAVVFRLKELVPEIQTGILSVGIENLGLASRANYYCPSFVTLLYYPGLVKKVHAKGGKVFAWTVDSAFWIKFLLHKGVDGIISNDPKLCGEIIR